MKNDREKRVPRSVRRLRRTRQRAENQSDSRAVDAPQRGDRQPNAVIDSIAKGLMLGR